LVLEYANGGDLVSYIERKGNEWCLFFTSNFIVNLIATFKWNLQDPAIFRFKFFCLSFQMKITVEFLIFLFFFCEHLFLCE
jgi:hypothetical protein